MKKVFITGASRGIGKAVAQIFLDEDWLVMGTSTTGKSPFKNENFKIFKLDISVPENIKELSENIIHSGTNFDVIINNAGISLPSDRDSVKTDSLRRILEVNLIGLIDLNERLIPLVNRGGHIINVSSGVASITGGNSNYAPAYRISKVAINMYTKTLAARLRDKGIIASSVDPGWVRTDMGGSSATRSVEAAAEDIYNLAITKVDSGYFWYGGKKRDW